MVNLNLSFKVPYVKIKEGAYCIDHDRGWQPLHGCTVSVWGWDPTKPRLLTDQEPPLSMLGLLFLSRGFSYTI